MDNNIIYNGGGMSPSRTATVRRQIMSWLLPDSSIVKMYVNPQNIVVSNSKTIKADRTKGGFVVQYWGEELTDISISGTTGSSGIEGINILDDIYRAEQVAFNVSALNQQAATDEDTISSWIDTLFPSLGDALDFFKGFGDSEANSPYPVPKPTLGYYASTIEMVYGGVTYRGYFTNFTVTENADNLGWFNYDMKFKATMRRGYRANYMPWHRNPRQDNEFVQSSEYWGDNMSFPPPVDRNSGLLLNDVALNGVTE